MSNRESSDGRYGIGLFPRDAKYPGIIMELRWKKALNDDTLVKLADEALAQIIERKYDAEMKNAGIRDVLKFGIAFSGKKVSIKTK